MSIEPRAQLGIIHRPPAAINYEQVDMEDSSSYSCRNEITRSTPLLADDMALI